MNRPARKEYDCIIVGGGPAGATASALLARHGHSTLLLERDLYPRHHIGESLQPHTYWTFQRLGVIEALEASNFVRKESVQFVNAEGKDSQPFYFTDRDPGAWSTTWQVPRDRFDVLMLDNARRCGAEVVQGARVSRALFDGDRAVGVRAKIDDQDMELSSRVVVDATGIDALLANQLRLREGDPNLRNCAIYSYYKGAQRDEGRNEGATLIIHTPERRGWFWFIPLPDDVTSVGVVGPPGYLMTGRGGDPGRTLDEEIAATPGAARRLQGAERVDRIRVCSDFTWRARQIAGDGWVLIGDAFAFLDPVYSSGVMLALKSGELAADAIHDALEAGDVSTARLGTFGPQFLHGVSMMRNLVYAFYDRKFSFGEFMKKHPEYHDHLVRLLIGDVFNNEVGAIFDVMKDWTPTPARLKFEGSRVQA